MRIFKFKKPVIIFNQIPKVEKDHKQLELLPEMNFFVVEEHRIFTQLLIFNQNKGKKRNGVYAGTTQKKPANQNHLAKIKNWYL